MKGESDTAMQVPDIIEFIVPPMASGQKLQLFLRDSLPLEPIRLIREAISSGRIRLDGQPCASNATLLGGESVSIHGLDGERQQIKLPSVPAVALYEDEHVLVLNKPAGCTVVQERGTDICPFQNGVLEYVKRSPAAAAAAMRNSYRPRAVHRLDRDTSGAVVVAKSREGELRLTQQFRDRTIVKEYLAVLHGELRDASGEISRPISGIIGDLARMQADDPGGKPSLTRYEVQDRFRGYTLVRAWPHTGRRHQIRVHFAEIGHPLVADQVYGGSPLFLSSVKRGYHAKEGEPEKPIMARAALHAAAITFLPVGVTDPIRVEAPLPKDMAVLLKALRKHAQVGGTHKRQGAG